MFFVRLLCRRGAEGEIDGVKTQENMHISLTNLNASDSELGHFHHKKGFVNTNVGNEAAFTETFP